MTAPTPVPPRNAPPALFNKSAAGAAHLHHPYHGVSPRNHHNRHASSVLVSIGSASKYGPFGVMIDTRTATAQSVVQSSLAILRKKHIAGYDLPFDRYALVNMSDGQLLRRSEPVGMARFPKSPPNLVAATSAAAVASSSSSLSFAAASPPHSNRSNSTNNLLAAPPANVNVNASHAQSLGKTSPQAASSAASPSASESRSNACTNSASNTPQGTPSLPARTSIGSTSSSFGGGGGGGGSSPSPFGALADKLSKQAPKKRSKAAAHPYVPPPPTSNPDALSSATSPEKSDKPKRRGRQRAMSASEPSAARLRLAGSPPGKHKGAGGILLALTRKSTAIAHPHAHAHAHESDRDRPPTPSAGGFLSRARASAGPMIHRVATTGGVPTSSPGQHSRALSQHSRPDYLGGPRISMPSSPKVSPGSNSHAHAHSHASSSNTVSAAASGGGGGGSSGGSGGGKRAHVSNIMQRFESSKKPKSPRVPGLNLRKKKDKGGGKSADNGSNSAAPSFTPNKLLNSGGFSRPAASSHGSAPSGGVDFLLVTLPIPLEADIREEDAFPSAELDIPRDPSHSGESLSRPPSVPPPPPLPMPHDEHGEPTQRPSNASSSSPYTPRPPSHSPPLTRHSSATTASASATATTLHMPTPTRGSGHSDASSTTATASATDPTRDRSGSVRSRSIHKRALSSQGKLSTMSLAAAAAYASAGGSGSGSGTAAGGGRAANANGLESASTCGNGSARSSRAPSRPGSDSLIGINTLNLSPSLNSVSVRKGITGNTPAPLSNNLWPVATPRTSAAVSIEPKRVDPRQFYGTKIEFDDDSDESDMESASVVSASIGTSIGAGGAASIGGWGSEAGGGTGASPLVQGMEGGGGEKKTHRGGGFSLGEMLEVLRVEREEAVSLELEFGPDSPFFRGNLEILEKRVRTFGSHVKELVARSEEFVDHGQEITKSMKQFVSALYTTWDGVELDNDGNPPKPPRVQSSMVNLGSVVDSMCQYLQELFASIREHFVKRLEVFRATHRRVKDNARSLKKAEADYEIALNKYLSQKVSSSHSRSGNRKSSMSVSVDDVIVQSFVDTKKLYELNRFDHIEEMNMIISNDRYQLIDIITSVQGSFQGFFEAGIRLTTQSQMSSLHENAELDDKLSECKHKKNLWRADRVQLEKSLEELRPTAHLLRPDPNDKSHSIAITKSGYLMKLSSSIKKDWKRRWFVLEDGHLCYYRSAQDEKPFNVVNILTCTVRETPKSELRFCFDIVSPNQRAYTLQAENLREYQSWIRIIQNCIEHLINTQSKPNRERTAEQRKLLKRLMAFNSVCADCGAKSPTWVSINIGAIVCIDCSGVHRSIGAHITKMRSIELDVIEVKTLELLIALGNERVNSVYEGNVPEQIASDEKATPHSSESTKRTWIQSKYSLRLYLAQEVLDMHAQPPEKIAQVLFEAVLANDLKRAMEVLASAPDTNYRSPMPATVYLPPESLTTPPGEVPPPPGGNGPQVTSVQRKALSATGNTYLHVAAAMDHRMMLTYLTLNGGTLSIKNDDGATVIDVARQVDAKDVLRHYNNN